MNVEGLNPLSGKESFRLKKFLDCVVNTVLIPLYVVSPVKKKKQERSFGNLPALIFLDNEHVHPVRSMDSPKFFLSNVEHNTLFLKVAK